MSEDNQNNPNNQPPEAGEPGGVNDTPKSDKPANPQKEIVEMNQPDAQKPSPKEQVTDSPDTTSIQEDSSDKQDVEIDKQSESQDTGYRIQDSETQDSIKEQTEEVLPEESLKKVDAETDKQPEATPEEKPVEADSEIQNLEKKEKTEDEQSPQQPHSKAAPQQPHNSPTTAHKPNQEKKVTTVKTDKPQAPKKIGKEVNKRAKNKHFLLGCFGIFTIIFILFIVLMVLVMSQGGESNPVLRSLGMDPAGIKAFLLTVISFSFGTLALIFFVLMVIGIFRLAGAKKDDKVKRGQGAKMTISGLISLFLILIIWFFLYGFIVRIEISSERVIAEIVVIEPKDLDNLQAPVEITFSLVNIQKAFHKKVAVESAAWDLDGDGEFETPANQEEVVHRYTLKGNYEVKLQVNVAGEEEPRIYPYSFSIKEAVFNAEPDSGTAPLTVQFDANDLIPRGFKIKSLDWDFEDDGTYELVGKDNLRPRHTFEKIGVYKVHLRIINQNNNVENVYREIEIKSADTPLLTAVIDATPGLSGSIPLQIRFDASNSNSVKGKIIKYEWDFGDGSNLQAGKSVSHIYEQPGFYTVALRIEEDSGKTAEASVEIDAQGISSAPEAKIITEPSAAEEGTLSGMLPFKVAFDASKSADADNDIIEYQWDFNDDGVIDQEGQKATYVFETVGTFIVGLTVQDSEGQINTESLIINVTEPGVSAVINAIPEEGTAPLIVQFDGSSSSAFEGNIVSYKWDFGDGSPKSITGATISHKYTKVGTYAVNLNVVTNQGESAEVSKMIYVREIPLHACFTPSRRNGEAPLSITFDPKCSTGAVSKFTWDFGDSEKSASRKPSHTFEVPGSYTVTLEVADDKNNVDTYTDVIVAEGEID